MRAWWDVLNLVKLGRESCRKLQELERVLTAFTAGLLLITVSELGDKTFFIAMILAMRHSQRLVLSAVTVALAAMTILSVMLGQVVALLPATFTHHLVVALFLGFGVKLLFDASRLPAEPNCAVVKEATAAVDDRQEKKSWWYRYPQLNVWCQGFVLTFLAEWGDRTQFSTIALAAAHNPIGVTLGAILGHAICALIAVVCGSYLAGRISERAIALIGGLLFLIFGAVMAVR
jgi:Ca2+/H+ antiporter, TMEM165/GDT1 family